jgi:hypothetical protein
MDTILKIKYSGAETNFLDPVELSQHPEDFLIFGLKNKVYCTRCHEAYRILKHPHYIKMVCGCGCRLIYPKNKDGVMVTTYISAAEFQKNGGVNGRNKQT